MGKEQTRAGRRDPQPCRISDSAGVEDQLATNTALTGSTRSQPRANWAARKGGQKAKLTDPDFVLWAAGLSGSQCSGRPGPDRARPDRRASRCQRILGAQRELHDRRDLPDSTQPSCCSQRCPPEADEVDSARPEVGAVKFEQQTKKSVAVRTTSESGKEVAGLVPWREVGATPRRCHGYVPAGGVRRRPPQGRSGDRPSEYTIRSSSSVARS